MGREKENLRMKVVVKTHRKHGNGAKGSDRKGQTGKRGIIYQLHENGTQTELARHDGSTFGALTRKLFGTNLIPRHVAINPSGATYF